MFHVIIIPRLFRYNNQLLKITGQRIDDIIYRKYIIIKLYYYDK